MFGYRFSDNEKPNLLNPPIVNSKSNLSDKKSKAERPDKSYEKSSLERIIAVVNDIHETNRSSTDYLKRLQTLFDANENYFSKIKERESRLVRIANLQQSIYTQISVYERHTDSNKIRQKSLNERRHQHEQNLLFLLSQQEQLKSLDLNLRQSQCLLQDLSKLISFRQRDLITEISRYIYPIIRESKDNYLIANIRLPSIEQRGYSSSLIRERETELIAAITFCAHIVLLLSKILHLPLRFPMEFCTSSSIKIYECSQVTSEYALSPISGNLSFYYGFYLLNRNIGQIYMHCCRETTEPDCRKTLKNLKTIMNYFVVRRSSTLSFVSSQRTNSRGGSISYNDQTMERNITKPSTFSSTISEQSSLIEQDDESDSMRSMPRSNSISPRLVMQYSQQNFSVN